MNLEMASMVFVRKIVNIVMFSAVICSNALTMSPECMLSECKVANASSIVCKIGGCTLHSDTVVNCNFSKSHLGAAATYALASGISLRVVNAFDIVGILGWLYLGARAVVKTCCCKPSLRDGYMQSCLQRFLSSNELSFIITTPSALCIVAKILETYGLGMYELDTFFTGLFPMLVGGIQAGYDMFKIANWGLKKCGCSWHHKLFNKWWFGFGKKSAPREFDEDVRFLRKLNDDIKELSNEKGKVYSSILEHEKEYILTEDVKNEVKIGANCYELLSKKSTIEVVLGANVTLNQLMEAGMTVPELKERGATKDQFIEALNTLYEND